MSDDLTVLIVGGYGRFGGRLARLLEDEPRLTLLIAGRSIEKATQYCQARAGAKARLVPMMFDRAGDLDTQLAEAGPDWLVDASGPFQAYDEAPYSVIEACIAKGVNYLDLADGSDFVAGVRTYDAAAQAAGVFALSGVSTFPVLTAAVVRRLATDMARLDAIAGGIAPSPYAGVGENVIRAIASYAGQGVSLKVGGAFTIGHPFTEQKRFVIAPPGRVPLRSTMFSLVDVPDLRALPELWPGAGNVWMGAGPVPETLHRALAALAWLVRLRLLPSLSPLAPLMSFAADRLRWGEHRGGMFVEVEGLAAGGAPIKRSWHLLAEGDDGPLIPSMGVEALVRNALNGHTPSPGARAGVTDLELQDYEALFAKHTIYTGVRDEASDGDTPLYAQVLGAAWAELPTEIRQMHAATRTASAKGRARIERGPGVLARVIAAVVRFPSAAKDTSVTVRFDASDGVETWTRAFGAETLSSRQFAGRGRSKHLLCERFGPLTFAMALIVEGGRLSLILRRWSIFGLPLPMWLCPRSDSYETVEDGRFHFRVEVSHPLVGLIVRYQGWLMPSPAVTPPAPRPTRSSRPSAARPADTSSCVRPG